MSEPEQIGHSDFVRYALQLNAAIIGKTGEEREAAEHELALLMRYNAQGRFAEWIAARGAQE